MLHYTKLVTITVLVAAGAVAVFTPSAETAGQAKLPGHPGPGPYVAGCVDCHTEGGADNIGALLEAMGHRNVDERTSTVPGDCAECHSEEGGSTYLSELAHIFHYENPGENRFIQVFGGDCLHCHALDAKTGEVKVKSGAKNW
jgi:cytochrome c553